MDPAFSRDGYSVARDVLTRATSTQYRDAVEALAEDEIGPSGCAYYEHGRVADLPALRPILWDSGVAAVVRATIGGQARCLVGLDTVGMNVSESIPHRDISVGRLPVRERDPWDGSLGVVRVVVYPSVPRWARFGLVPGSHRTPGAAAELFSTAPTQWLTIGPGDVLLFDPRLVHAGGEVVAPRPMIVLTYGRDDDPACDVYFDARLRTPGLGFRDPPDGVVDQLRRHDLMLEAAVDPERWSAHRRWIESVGG